MDPTAEPECPKARSQGLTVQELAAELVVYDEPAARAHCLNSTASLVWRYCDGATTVAAMAARLGGEAGATVDEEIVLFALRELGNRDLLEQPVRADRGALSRRQALVRLGATAGILLPMITSIVAPSSTAAQSGSSSGATSSGATSSGATSSGATSSGATSSGAA